MRFLTTFKALLRNKDENKVSPFQDSGILLMVSLDLGLEYPLPMRQVCFPTGGTCLYKQTVTSWGIYMILGKILGMGTHKVWVD